MRAGTSARAWRAHLRTCCTLASSCWHWDATACAAATLAPWLKRRTRCSTCLSEVELFSTGLVSAAPHANGGVPAAVRVSCSACAACQKCISDALACAATVATTALRALQAQPHRVRAVCSVAVHKQAASLRPSMAFGKTSRVCGPQCSASARFSNGASLPPRTLPLSCSEARSSKMQANSGKFSQVCVVHQMRQACESLCPLVLVDSAASS